MASLIQEELERFRKAFRMGTPTTFNNFLKSLKRQDLLVPEDLSLCEGVDFSPWEPKRLEYDLLLLRGMCVSLGDKKDTFENWKKFFEGLRNSYQSLKKENRSSPKCFRLCNEIIDYYEKAIRVVDEDIKRIGRLIDQMIIIYRRYPIAEENRILETDGFPK